MNQTDPLLALIEWGKTAWAKIQAGKAEGQEDIDALLASADPMVRAEAEKVLRLDTEVRAKMSPPGALGLPPLLESRRLQYGITDGAFKTQAFGERIVVWQMPVAKKTEGGILLPESTQSHEQATSPKAVLVSAGLAALDILRGHGIELGSIVRTIAYAPLRLEADIVGGKSVPVLPMNCGEILGAEDTFEALRDGRLRIEFNGTQHVYVSAKTGAALADQPKLPYVNPAEW